MLRKLRKRGSTYENGGIDFVNNIWIPGDIVQEMAGETKKKYFWNNMSSR